MQKSKMIISFELFVLYFDYSLLPLISMMTCRLEPCLKSGTKWQPPNKNRLY